MYLYRARWDKLCTSTVNHLIHINFGFPNMVLYRKLVECDCWQNSSPHEPGEAGCLLLGGPLNTDDGFIGRNKVVSQILLGVMISEMPDLGEQNWCIHSAFPLFH